MNMNQCNETMKKTNAILGCITEDACVGKLFV